MSGANRRGEQKMTVEKKGRIIIACNCSHYGLIDRRKQDRYLQKADNEGIRIETVPDLCGAVVEQKEKIAELVKGYDSTIVACHPRAIKGLMRVVGIDLSRELVSFVNVRKELSHGTVSFSDSNPDAGNSGAWVPWYPVIDRERCKDCGLCLEFCLFGVYEKKDGKVLVSNPANCKTNCPACARICPEAAIMFPKFNESPVDGDEIGELSEARSKIKVDMEKLFDGDIYEKLAARRARNRKSILTRDAGKALAEREACSRGEDGKNC